MYTSLFFHSYSRPHRDLHSFPTRRSSDLPHRPKPAPQSRRLGCHVHFDELTALPRRLTNSRFPQTCPNSSNKALEPKDRKSTRLNSSHANISYAVFCLKKKKQKAYSHTTS